MDQPVQSYRYYLDKENCLKKINLINFAVAGTMRLLMRSSFRVPRQV